MRDARERELDLQLEQLEEEERDVSLRRRKLHDRIAIFPDNAARAELERRERELSKERRELHRRIDLLRAERTDVRSHHDPARP